MGGLNDRLLPLKRGSFPKKDSTLINVLPSKKVPLPEKDSTLKSDMKPKKAKGVTPGAGK